MVFPLCKEPPTCAESLHPRAYVATISLIFFPSQRGFKFLFPEICPLCFFSWRMVFGISFSWSTHILEEFKLVKISSNVPRETRFTNKLRVSFFGMF